MAVEHDMSCFGMIYVLLRHFINSMFTFTGLYIYYRLYTVVCFLNRDIVSLLSPRALY